MAKKACALFLMFYLILWHSPSPLQGAISLLNMLITISKTIQLSGDTFEQFAKHLKTATETVFAISDNVAARNEKGRLLDLEASLISLMADKQFLIGQLTAFLEGASTAETWTAQLARVLQNLTALLAKFRAERGPFVAEEPEKLQQVLTSLQLKGELLQTLQTMHPADSQSLTEEERARLRNIIEKLEYEISKMMLTSDALAQYIKNRFAFT